VLYSSASVAGARSDPRELSVSVPTLLGGGMGILGVDVFIRPGVRYANRLGRLFPVDSMLTLGRLGDAPAYRIYQKYMTRGGWDALTVSCGAGSAGGGNAKLDFLRRGARASSGSRCSGTF